MPKQNRIFACESRCASCPIVDRRQEVAWAVGLALRDNSTESVLRATPDQRLAMADAALSASGPSLYDQTHKLGQSIAWAMVKISEGKCARYE